ncbi:MAG: hypothetical protein ACLTS6_14615 [Anaerobutyricum sp.]
MRSVYVFCADGFEEVGRLDGSRFIKKSGYRCENGVHYGQITDNRLT